MAAPSIEDLKDLLQLWSDVDTENVLADTELDALGIESKGLASLLMDIQQQFGMEIEPDDLLQLRTFGDLVQLVQNKAA